MKRKEVRRGEICMIRRTANLSRGGVGVRLNIHGLRRDDELHDHITATLEVLRGLLECRLSTFITSEIMSSEEGWGRGKRVHWWASQRMAEGDDCAFFFFDCNDEKGGGSIWECGGASRRRRLGFTRALRASRRSNIIAGLCLEPSYKWCHCASLKREENYNN